MKKIDVESVIAEVVNETLPSNEQMKTVRILRKVLNEHNEDIVVPNIAHIQELMQTQDNRGTSYPVFIVVEDKKIYGVCSSHACDGKDRVDSDVLDKDDLCETCKATYEEHGDYPDECEECPDETFINYRIEEDVPNMRAGFFFTSEACEHHIRTQRHHYNSTAKSYAISACYNNELKEVMEMLCPEQFLR